MKNLYRSLLLVFALLAPAAYLSAQPSQNKVTFEITYNPSNQRYTTYVVPEYAVPNSVNTTQSESGATAQVTLAVPKDFIINNIEDITGNWEKNPFKLGPGQPGQDYSGYSLDPATNYYAIGKTVGQTIYGAFTPGVPVALFSFTGTGSTCFGQIRIIEPDEPFIVAAFEALSFNIPNSFYSKSSDNIVEQFRAISGLPACCGVITFAAPADVCLDAGIQTGLGGGLPVGGVYSGPGVTDNGNGTTYSFNPAVAGVGTHTISYTSNVCSISATDAVKVLPYSVYPQTVTVSSPITTNVSFIQAGAYILATNKILQPTGKAEYRAVNSVLLDAGFEVENGAVFKATIRNSCESAPPASSAQENKIPQEKIR